MNKLLGSIINKFDAEAKNHMERQSLNPFSGNFSRSPSPRLSKDQYGRPLAGSKTEERGQKAKCHILREIQDLCNCIHDLGVYNKTHKQTQDSDDEEDHNDEEIIITFGEIFQMYTKINDKVVGLLIAAKKRGFIFFEKEILFQRRDDDVLIALIKPINEIRDIINKELAAAKSPVSFQSRDASPLVGDDSDTDKSTGNIPNGSSGASSKSGSGSPVENKNKRQTKSKTPTDGSVGTSAIDTDKSVAQSSAGVGSEEINEAKKENNDANVNSGNEEPAKPSVDKMTAPSPVSNEHTNGESGTKDNEETKSEAIEVVSPTQKSETVEICAVPSVEVTCEAEPLKHDIASDETSSEQIAQSSTEPIPTIEITKAATPERGSSEEPIAIEVNADEPNCEESKNNETTQDKTCDVSESSEVNVIRNDDLSKESIENGEDIGEVLPEKTENADAIIATEVIEATKTDDLAVQTIDEPAAIQVPSEPVIDNERKRTFSNEELIEGLAAALSGRSSSPDICDEEVEQIFQSHAAIAPLLNDPIQEINRTPDTDTLGIRTKHDNSEVSIDTSEQIKVPTPETFTSKTPENTVPETITTTSENTGTPTMIIEPTGETNSVNIVSSPKTIDSSLETEIQNSEEHSDTISDIKVPTPDQASETEIPATETNEPTPDTIIKVKTPIPEPATEENSTA